MSGEDLLVELEQKENDLLLVAKLKNLLEERDRLEQDLSALRTDFACLEEVINFVILNATYSHLIGAGATEAGVL